MSWSHYLALIFSHRIENVTPALAINYYQRIGSFVEDVSNNQGRYHAQITCFSPVFIACTFKNFNLIRNYQTMIQQIINFKEELVLIWLIVPLKIYTSPFWLPTTNSCIPSSSTSPRVIAFLKTEPEKSNSKRSTKDTALIFFNQYLKLIQLKKWFPLCG